MQMIHDFYSQYKTVLDAFVRMSRTAGCRSDYVQGGGGNTSCKLDNALMAIKASGYRLDQIGADTAYAVLDYKALRDFYGQTDPSLLSDVEQAGSARAKSATKAIEGMAPLRPSVEAGFHALLDQYVLHTHPVYANLVTCSAEGPEIAAKALSGISAGHVFIPYINPGAQLTFAMQKAIRQETARSGRAPGILFMQNHGLVVTGNDIDACLDLHGEINQRIAAAFSVSDADWPVVTVKPAAGQPGAAGQAWQSATPWLTQRLRLTEWDLDLFTTQSLYPDQLVFLGGQMGIVAEGTLAEAVMKDASAGQNFPDKCTIFRQTGEVFYRCGRNEAQTMEETLCAVLFINQVVRRSGCHICTMSEAGRQFISNWEGEQYRKNITAR